MSQRMMLVLAAALSAFVLVLVGGATIRLTAQSSAAPTPSATVAATPAPAPPVGIDPTAVQALIAQRDQ